MEEAIRREKVGEIVRKLNESKNHLQKGNIYSCIVSFKDVLEKMLVTKMLASDEKELNNEINYFQQNLSSSRIFREVYGPVTFRDNDLSTALAFMKQLVQIKEEESQAIMAKNTENADNTKEDLEDTGANRQVQQIKVLIERGDYASAQETIADDEDVIFQLMEEYNTEGINHRRANRYDEAISEFRKALVVNPRDEGLYYNIARVYIAKEEWKRAAETICEGLQINPHFGEGIKLLKYIRETGGVDV